MASVILRGGLQPNKTSMLFSSIRCMATATQEGFAEASDVNWNNARPYEEIPGPKPLPIIGNLHQFISGIGEMSHPDIFVQFEGLMKKYGKIVRLSKVPGRHDMVFLFDPKLFEKVYRMEGPWPDRDTLQSLVYYRKIHRKDFFKGVGGLLTAYGEEWKTFRNKVNPPMMQPRSATMYLRPIIEVSNEFIERTKILRDTKSEMPDDYLNEINRWALESITMIALDKRLGCLDPNMKPDSEPQKMINAVQENLRYMEVMEFGPPYWKIISTPIWRKFVKEMDYVTSVADKIITDAIKKMTERKAGADYEPSVLERLLLRDPDPRTACVMALDMILAGVDTTSYSVAGMLYHLSKNQEKQELLYKELVKFLPNKEDEITVDILEDMKYLKACTKESMRISGVASVIARFTNKDIVIGNYRIPKDVNILMPHLFLGQMDEHYPLASRYIPERWLKARPGQGDSIGSAEDYDFVKGFNTNPFVFMPFGFGPRMCIGKRFAEMEIAVLMTKLIRNFKVEYNYGDMKFTSKLIYRPVNPQKYKVTDRKD